MLRQKAVRDDDNSERIILREAKKKRWREKTVWVVLSKEGEVDIKS
jgi:hypothetical protein